MRALLGVWLIAVPVFADQHAILVGDGGEKYVLSEVKCKIEKEKISVDASTSNASGKLHLVVEKNKVARMSFKDRDGDTWSIRPKVHPYSNCKVAVTVPSNEKLPLEISLICQKLSRIQETIIYDLHIPHSHPILCARVTTTK